MQKCGIIFPNLKGNFFMKELDYFNILPYIDSFLISQEVLEHLAEVQEAFNKYLNKLIALGDNAADFLMLELYNELLFSNQIEGEKLLSPEVFLQNNLVQLGKYLTNKKICDIQRLLLQYKDMPYPKGEYRNVPVFIKKDGNIVYYAPKSEAVPNFMQDFITFFNRNSDNLIDNDPFIKAALLHFLFIKIHPFVDGNGRVSRILHNLKFTDLINRTYNSDKKFAALNINPINISYSIYNNKATYCERLNSIIFAKDADINESVNKWINFLLYMYEEQLNYCEYTNKIEHVAQTLQRIKRK